MSGLQAARQALEQIVALRDIGWYAHPGNYQKRVKRIARAALAVLDAAPEQEEQEGVGAGAPPCESSEGA